MLRFYAVGERSYALCVMTTRSMEPSIFAGDLLLVEKPARPDYSPGDMVLLPAARPELTPFVHRLVAVRTLGGRRQVLSKGDLLAHLDPPAPGVSPEEVLGRVTLIRRRDGSWRSATGFASRAAGRLAAAVYGVLYAPEQEPRDRLKGLNRLIASVLGACLPRARRPFAELPVGEPHEAR